MALDLTLKITADASEAKRALSDVEGGIKKVESAAKSTERPIQNTVSALGAHRGEVDRVVDAGRRLEEQTRKVTGTATVYTQAQRDQALAMFGLGAAHKELNGKLDILDGKLAATTTTFGLSSAALSAWAAAAVLVAAGIGAMVTGLANATKFYFETSAATKDSRDALVELGKTWDAFKFLIGGAVLGEDFSIVRPIRALEWALGQVTIKIASMIDQARTFIGLLALIPGPMGAAARAGQFMLTSPSGDVNLPAAGTYTPVPYGGAAMADPMGALGGNLFFSMGPNGPVAGMAPPGGYGGPAAGRKTPWQVPSYGLYAGIPSSPGHQIDWARQYGWTVPEIGMTSGLPDGVGTQMPMPGMPVTANRNWFQSISSNPYVRAGVGALAGPALGAMQSSQNRAVSTMGRMGSWALMGASIGGPWGAAAGAAAGLVAGLFAKPAGRKEDDEANLELDKLRTRLLDTHGSLERLRQLGNLTGDDLASAFGHRGKRGLEEFQKQVSEFEQRQERLQNAIEKYGFTWEELGPKIQQLRLNDFAQELTADMEVLLAAGVPVEKVFERMAPAFSQMVQNAMAAGIAIPSHMQPILQKLIDLGLLVDKDGQKMTDLSQVKFSPDITATLEQGFQRVVDKLNDLLVGLGILPKAAEDAAHGMREAFRDFEFPRPPDYVPDPDPDNPDRGPRRHGGGEVSDGVSYDAGGEVRIRAQAREWVMQRAAVAKYGRNFMHAVNSGTYGGGGMTLVVNFQQPFLSDDHTTLAKAAEYLARATEDELRRRGLRLPSV
jgi:hypothetical protein